MAWQKVSEKRPCAVCKNTGWCTFTADGAMAKCMRVKSGTPAKGDGGGYLHKVGTVPRGGVREQFPKVPARKPIDFTAMHLACVGCSSSEIAKVLGVSWESLKQLGIGFNVFRDVWTFPMRDETGKIIGIRTRARDGSKKAIGGSRAGLFIPCASVGRTLFVAEGPTDTAALLDAGAAAIGRPACLGQEQMIARFVRRTPGVERVVIVPDCDPKAKRTAREMTARGTERLHDELRKAGFAGEIKRMSVRPHKDVRAWWIADPQGLRAAVAKLT